MRSILKLLLFLGGVSFVYTILIWQPNNNHFLYLLFNFFNLPSSPISGFNFNYVLEFFLAFFYIIFIALIIPQFLWKVVLRRESAVEVVKAQATFAIGIPVFMLLLELIARSTYIPLRAFWFGLFGEFLGAIVAVIGFLIVLSIVGRESTSSYTYSASWGNDSSSNAEKYDESTAQSHNDDAAVSSRTEVSYNIFDGILDCVTGTDSYGEQHECIITTEKGIEIKGYGMSAEDAEADARKNYDYYQRTGYL